MSGKRRDAQMRFAMMILAMLALLATGCGSAVRYVYIKSGATAEERDRDESECIQRATITDRHESFDPSQLKRCMTRRGYEVHEVES